MQRGERCQTSNRASGHAKILGLTPFSGCGLQQFLTVLLILGHGFVLMPFSSDASRVRQYREHCLQMQAIFTCNLLRRGSVEGRREREKRSVP